MNVVETMTPTERERRRRLIELESGQTRRTVPAWVMVAVTVQIAPPPARVRWRLAVAITDCVTMPGPSAWKVVTIAAGVVRLRAPWSGCAVVRAAAAALAGSAVVGVVGSGAGGSVGGVE